MKLKSSRYLALGLLVACGVTAYAAWTQVLNKSDSIEQGRLIINDMAMNPSNSKLYVVGALSMDPDLSPQGPPIWQGGNINDAYLDLVSVAYDGTGTSSSRINDKVEDLAGGNGPLSDMYGVDNNKAVTVDGDGDVIVAGLWTRDGADEESVNQDLMVKKYSSSLGNVAGPYYYGHATGSDSATDVTTDSEGDIYVTGYTSGTDMVTIKLDGDDLSQIWVATESTGGADSGVQVLHRGDFCYAVGNYNGDVVVSKYDDADGSLEWRYVWDASGDGLGDVAAGIAVSSTGLVYVAATAATASGGDLALLKLNSSGANQWTQYYNGYGGGPLTPSDDIAVGVVLDADERPTIGGSGRGSSSVSRDLIAVKYTTGGSNVWTAVWDSGSSFNDIGKSIGVDSSGNIYMFGGDLGRYAMARFNNSTGSIDSGRSQVINGNDRVPVKMVVSADGDVFMTGQGISSPYKTVETVAYTE